MAVRGHNACVGEHPGHHQRRANDQWPAASPAVDENKSEYRHEDVDNVLNRGRDQIGIAGETGHPEDIRDIQHHHVHP